MFSRDDLRRLRTLAFAVEDREATLAELYELASLLDRSGVGVDYGLEALVRESGLSSIAEFHRQLPEAHADRAVRNIVATVAGILMGYAVEHTLGPAEA